MVSVYIRSRQIICCGFDHCERMFWIFHFLPGYESWLRLTLSALLFLFYKFIVLVLSDLNLGVYGFWFCWFVHNQTMEILFHPHVNIMIWGIIHALVFNSLMLL